MKDKTAGFVGAICLIIIPIALAYVVYSMAELKAEAYNRNLGTSYTPFDIIMGVHDTARDFR